MGKYACAAVCAHCVCLRVDLGSACAVDLLRLYLCLLQCLEWRGRCSFPLWRLCADAKGDVRHRTQVLTCGGRGVGGVWTDPRDKVLGREGKRLAPARRSRSVGSRAAGEASGSSAPSAILAGQCLAPCACRAWRWRRSACVPGDAWTHKLPPPPGVLFFFSLLSPFYFLSSSFSVCLFVLYFCGAHVLVIYNLEYIACTR